MSATVDATVDPGSRRPGPLLPRDAWPIAATTWVAARVLVAVGNVVARLVDDRASGTPSRIDEALLAWDGGWYERIATDGYRAGGEEARFAPAFAALGRLVGLPFGDRPVVGLVVVANVAALVAGVAVIGYVRQLVADGAIEPVGRRAEWLVSAAVALWPASFVLVFAYAESLLLVTSILAVLCARRGRWGLVAVFGLIAGLSRPTGAALVVVLVILAWRQGPERRPWRLVAAAAPVVGLVGHLGAVRLAGGAWWEALDEQRPHRGDFVDPVSRLARGVGDLFGDERLGDGLHLPFALVALALVVLVFREVGVAEGCWCAVVLAVSLSADNWNSLERYVLNAFPFCIAAGLWLARRSWAPLAVAGSAMGLVALSALAWVGEYVP